VTGSSQESIEVPSAPGVTPLPGAQVRVAMTKWGDRPHWEYDAVFLGSDEHGDWIGCAAGTFMARPGAEYVAPVDQVCLVPTVGSDLERSFVATFHAPGGPVSVYVDMTTPPRWSGGCLSSVDLDLDVIRGTGGRVWVDDEDEFAEHRIAFDYPEPLVALASASCDRIEALLRDEIAPFDGSSANGWFTLLAALVTDRPSPGGPRAV
jgi:uncharacterized protein